MIEGRDKQRVELSTLQNVRDEGNSYSLTMKDSWSLYISKDECGDFVPREGDWIVVSYHGFNSIAGIIIEGRVLRSKTTKQMEAEHQEFIDSIRLKRLEEYVANHDKVMERVNALPAPLRERMLRFGNEGGKKFWIEDATYELVSCEGAAALLRKSAEEVGLEYNGFGFSSISNGKEQEAIKWIDDWWALNTKEHDYNYAKQMELVPDFGEGHSGNTAGGAYMLAKHVLNGRDV